MLAISGGSGMVVDIATAGSTGGFVLAIGMICATANPEISPNKIRALHTCALLRIWNFGFLPARVTEAMSLADDYSFSTVILSTYFTQSDP